MSVPEEERIRALSSGGYTASVQLKRHRDAYPDIRLDGEEGI